jgi:hypothetical protein
MVLSIVRIPDSGWPCQAAGVPQGSEGLHLEPSLSWHQSWALPQWVPVGTPSAPPPTRSHSFPTEPGDGHVSRKFFLDPSCVPLLILASLTLRLPSSSATSDQPRPLLPAPPCAKERSRAEGRGGHRDGQEHCGGHRWS